MAENNATTTTTATATIPVVSEKAILATVAVPNFPDVKRHTSTAIESKGKPEQSSGPFDWFEFPRSMTLADLEKFFATVVQPGKDTLLTAPVSFMIDTLEAALKTAEMNRTRTQLKRARLGKATIDPVMKEKLDTLSRMKQNAKTPQHAKVVQATIDSILDELNARLAAMDSSTEAEDIQE